MGRQASSSALHQVIVLKWMPLGGIYLLHHYPPTHSLCHQSASAISMYRTERARGIEWKPSLPSPPLPCVQTSHLFSASCIPCHDLNHFKIYCYVDYIICFVLFSFLFQTNLSICHIYLSLILLTNSYIFFITWIFFGLSHIFTVEKNWRCASWVCRPQTAMGRVPFDVLLSLSLSLCGYVLFISPEPPLYTVLPTAQNVCRRLLLFIFQIPVFCQWTLTWKSTALSWAVDNVPCSRLTFDPPVCWFWDTATRWRWHEADAGVGTTGSLRMHHRDFISWLVLYTGGSRTSQAGTIKFENENRPLMLFNAFSFVFLNGVKKRKVVQNLVSIECFLVFLRWAH